MFVCWKDIVVCGGRGDGNRIDSGQCRRSADTTDINAADISTANGAPAACSKPPGSAVPASAGDDEVHSLGAFALLVRLDIERDALPLGQRLQSRPLDGGDVHKHVASAIVRLDEAVAALRVEELDRTCHGHRETPFPVVAPPSAPAARRLGRTFTNGGKQMAFWASVTPPAPTGGGTSKPARIEIG